jgi:V/A-type H+/Na+-transporting ATPase subunit C
MSQLTKYAFANAKIRAMLSRLLEPQFFDSLLSAKDFAEAIELLKKTPYERIFEEVDSGAEDIRRLEDDITVFDENAFRKVSSILMAAEKQFVLLLLEKFEIEALKVALRLWYQKSPAAVQSFPKVPVVHPVDYAKIMNAHSVEELIVLLAETPYFKALAKGREKFKEHNSLFCLEASLDIDYYERVRASIAQFSPSDQEMAMKVIGIEIDIENITWLIRMRKYYDVALGDMLEWVIPGGERVTKDAVRKSYATDGLGRILESVAIGPYAKIKDLSEQNMQLIENFLYDILLRQVKRALAGFPFSIGTVLGYLILKRRESRNIISILNAKRLGWKKETLSSALAI